MKLKIPAIICVILFLTFLAAGVVAVVAQDASIVDNSEELFKEIKLFSASMTLISTDYVKPIKVKDIVYGAIRGMMATLDGYSEFLDPDSFREITEETMGEFGGIGIEVGMREGILTVITPIDDGPAQAAGIQTGDCIVKIDGESTRDLFFEDAVKKLRGEPGSVIRLSIVREGVDDVIEYELERKIIKLKSIEDAGILEGDIAYIRIAEFQEPTGRDFAAALKKLKEQGAKGLIVDVRNNPGGLLDSSVELSGQFLSPDSLIVYTEGRDPQKRIDFRAKDHNGFEDMKLVVLVNKGTASAAEIFAGAMKDHKRGLIVGTTTFGKGSVQTVIPLEDNSGLKLTTAAYYTPSGFNLMDKGIEPDIRVENSKEIHKDETGGKIKEVFGKVKDEDKKDVSVTEKPEEAKSAAEDEEGGDIGPDKLKYDAQLRAAVNIIKGARIFDEYKNSQDMAETAPQVSAAATTVSQ